MRITIIIIVAILLIGCRSKKVTSVRTSKDSIRTNKVIKVTPQQLNSVVIDQLCDSLGNLKPFKYTFGSGKTKTTLKAVNDTLYLTQNIDSIVDSRVEKFKSSVKDTSIEEVKYIKRPFNLYSIFLNIILAMWIFRKPLIKLIKPL